MAGQMVTFVYSKDYSGCSDGGLIMEGISGHKERQVKSIKCQNQLQRKIEISSLENVLCVYVHVSVCVFIVTKLSVRSTLH